MIPDQTAIFLTLKLAFCTTLILLLLGTPLAWWLAQTRSRGKPVIEAIVALPLVLPPTVIGFYVLIMLSPETVAGRLWLQITGDTLTFSFSGLVAASVLYSLPFMVQPLQSAFEPHTRTSRELASSLGASPLDSFFSVVIPSSVRGFLTACVLTFAHTLGEFGIVLMVGGNISGRTRVISIAIYENVETLRYDEAHALSLIMLAISFIVLVFVYGVNRKFPVSAHAR